MLFGCVPTCLVRVCVVAMNAAPAGELGTVLSCSAKSRTLSTSATRPVGTHWGINNAPLRSVVEVERWKLAQQGKQNRKQHEDIIL